jgi:hypothetical protein
MLVRFAKALRERTVAVRWIAALGGILLLSIAQAQGQQAQEQQSFVTIEGDLKSAAWWVLADFHPFTTEVRGIPVNQIRKNWCKATEFRKDLFPRQLLFDGNVDLMEADKMSFAVEGHFDGSAASEVALVGVYQECAGKKGTFVLILDQLADGKSKIRFVSATPADHQFGALEQGEGNTIVAWSCMECDGRSVLKWDRKKRKFGWLPDPSD